MTRDKKFVIPLEMLPPSGKEEITGVDGKQYLLENEAMFTAYKHSRGEFSEFFITLRDKCRILGNRCPSCHQIICPPFEKRCPQCNFVEMQSEEMKDIGLMAASPVIAFFTPARFKDDAPYGEGYVFLDDKNGKEADTAIKLRVRTTRGMLKPGIFKKDTMVKIIFSDKRGGEILDIFAVPQYELSEEQILKSPLMESDLSWDKPQEPSLGESTEEMRSLFNRMLDGFKALSLRVEKSGRAQKDLANWQRSVNIKTRGGVFSLLVDKGHLQALDGLSANPDLVFVAEDPGLFLSWLEKGSALTNFVMEGTLWVNKSELETIFRLDRLPRSLRRDNC